VVIPPDSAAKRRTLFAMLLELWIGGAILGY